MLNATDVKIEQLMKAWHENQTQVGNLKGLHEAVTSSYTKKAIDRTKFIALNMGGSGHFLVDRKTEMVYSIKGYGIPNLKKPRGTVEFLTEFIRHLTALGKEYTFAYWYDMHRITKQADDTFDTKRYESRSGEANLIYANATAKL